MIKTLMYYIAYILDMVLKSILGFLIYGIPTIIVLIILQELFIKIWYYVIGA